MGFYSVFYYFYIVTETSSTAETHATQGPGLLYKWQMASKEGNETR